MNRNYYHFNFQNSVKWMFSGGTPRVIDKTITGTFPLTWQDGIGGALVNYSLKGATGKAVTIGGVEYGVPDGYTVILNGIGNKNNYATIPSLTIDTTDTLYAEFTLSGNGNRMFGNQSASTRCYVAASGNGTSMFCGKTYPVHLSEWTIDGSTINTLEMDASGITVNGNVHAWSGGTLAQDVVTDFGINEIIGSTSGSTTSISGFCLFLLKDANGNHKHSVMFLRKDNDNSVICYDFAKKVFYAVTGTLTSGKTTKTVEVGGQSIEVPLFHYRGVGDYVSSGEHAGKYDRHIVTATGGMVAAWTKQWTYRSDLGQGIFATTSISDKKAGNTNIYCPKYTTVNKESASLMSNGEIKGHPTTTYVFICDTRFNNASDFIANLQSENVWLNYQHTTDNDFTVNHYHLYTDEQGFSCGDVADEVSFLGGDVQKCGHVTLSEGTHSLTGAKSNGQYITSIPSSGTLTGTSITIPSGYGDVEVLFELATPVTKQITAPTVQTQTGMMHFDVVAEVKPSGGSVTYNSRRISV